MTLTDRLTQELSRFGLASHPIRHLLPAIVQDHQRRRRWQMVSVGMIAAMVGFATCFVWLGVRLEVLSANVAEWQAVAEHSWQHHHPPVKIGKAQAQVLTTQIEQRREDTNAAGH
jgi:bifunctional pyridoxal-dependent enzyme with beta-cystathionase and maltose regulon repressor activities